MKNILLITLSILLIFSCSKPKDEYEVGEIYYKGHDLVVEKFSDKLVTGTIYIDYPGKKVILGKVKDGKMYGKWTSWYRSGVKETEVYYNDGKMDGDYIEYYEDGEKQKEGEFFNGKKTGTWKYYYKDGSIRLIEDCSKIDCN